MMKKIFRTALAGFLMGQLLAMPLQARVTGTQPSRSTPDTWCVGRSGAEVCVDYSGNLIPTTDNDTTLGTSSLRWATGYIVDLAVGDDLTVTGDLDVTGVVTASSGTFSSYLKATARFQAPPFSEAVLKVTTPTVTGELYYDTTNKEFVQSTGTTTCFDYAKIEDPTAAPDGW